MSSPQPPGASPGPSASPRWSARHRWPVFTLWFVATIGLYVAEPGGRRDPGPERRLERHGRIALRVPPRDGGLRRRSGTAETEPVALPRRRDPPRHGTVDDPATAAALHDIAARTTALQATVDGASVPAFKDVVDPLVVPPNVGLVSPDRTAVRLVATVPGDNTEIGERLEPVPAFVDQLRADYPGFTIHALNNTLANDDISELVNKDLDASLQITHPADVLRSCWSHSARSWRPRCRSSWR